MQNAPTDPTERELLRLIGHGMRRALTGVVEASNIIQTLHRPEMFDKTQTEVRYIQSSARQALSNFDALFELLWLGQAEKKVETIAIPTLLNEVVREANEKLSLPPSAIVIDCSADLSTITGEPDTLRLVLVRMIQTVRTIADTSSVFVSATAKEDSVVLTTATQPGNPELPLISPVDFARNAGNVDVVVTMLLCIRTAVTYGGTFAIGRRESDLKLRMCFNT